MPLQCHLLPAPYLPSHIPAFRSSRICMLSFHIFEPLHKAVPSSWNSLLVLSLDITSFSKLSQGPSVRSVLLWQSTLTAVREVSPQAVVRCSSPTPQSKQPEWELDFLCLHSWHLLWYVAYNGYSIHIMGKNSTLRKQLLWCHAFPLLELFHHYLTSAFISSNIFLSTSFFSVHTVFSSPSPFLKRQSPFFNVTFCCWPVLRKQHALVWSVSSLPFHSFTHQTLASAITDLPKFLIQKTPIPS